MGVNHSTHERRMSSSGDDSDGPTSLFGSGLVRLTDEDLPGLMEYLVRSGQFRFASQSESGSDNNSSEGEEPMGMTGSTAQANPTPNTETLQRNDIHTSILLSSGRLGRKRWLHYMRPTVPNMISMNQLGLTSRQQLTPGEMTILNSRFLPNRMERMASYNHKAFCGKYSEDGNVFMTACQDQRIRVYNMDGNNMELVKSIAARDVGWSVLDTAFSPDGRYAAYSSWSDMVHLCSVDKDYDVHEPLFFDPEEHSFCIFSLMFSSDNQEILGGANDGHIYVFDRDANKRSLKIQAHDDDVNTVRFANESSQILYSGGDDGLCKVWDRRTLSEEHPAPVGVMAGHTDGITYIDSKGDSRYFISNSKDQSLKLWDVRCFSEPSGIAETKRRVSSQRWDYRWETIPRRSKNNKAIRGDTSIMTYKGHCILQTLIRCKFSPSFSTGQRYIYTGCAKGSVMIYDVLTGQVVRRLEGHDRCVRDVDWHPYKNILMSTSWDGTIGQWTYFDYHAQAAEPGETVFEPPQPVKDRTRRGSFRSSKSKRLHLAENVQEDVPRGLFD